MIREHDVIPARFFPATRIGIIIGLVVGLGSAVVIRMVPTVEPVVAVDVPPQMPPPLATNSNQAQRANRGPMVRVAVAGPAIVNVWLEGCADCMPAFEAWRKLYETGVVRDFRVQNVAYGSASPDFARKYHVDDALSFDDGARIVTPLGISSFTTLVIDKSGNVVHRDRPDRDGFVERVHEAWERVHEGH